MADPKPEALIHHEPSIHSPVPSLRVRGIGYYPHKHSVVTEAYDQFAIAFVFRGRGWFRTRTGSRQNISAPFYFWIKPMVPNLYGPDTGTTWEERFLTLGGERPCEWEAQGWIPAPQRAYPLPNPAECERLHKQVFEDFLSRDPDRMGRAKLAIERIVFELGRHARRGGRSDSPETRLDEQVQAWQREPSAPVDLATAAAECGLSYSRFRHLFRSRYAESPYQYLLRLRLERAKQLLDTRTHSVKEIAHLSGFESVESFDRAFRRSEGLTPTAYRDRDRSAFLI
jgi:AraC-like DNA-binding protein